MKIERVDFNDDNALAAWHAAWDAGARAGRDDPPIWRLSEITALLRDTNPGREEDMEAWVAVEDGEVRAAASLNLPLLDNVDRAGVEVNVPPAHRRQGVGSALFEQLAARAGELGRGKLDAQIAQPIGAGRVPGAAFAATRGFTRRNAEIRRGLGLPVATALLDRLETEAAQRHQGYRVVCFSGATPPEYAEQYAYLKSRLLTDAPTGELQFEPERWDVARLRAAEELTQRQGRLVLTAVAIAPDQKLAGHTQITVPGHDNGKCFQQDTLVLPEHRGHRLGAALKVANLRRLSTDHPDRARVETWNAADNAPMNAVNDKLGFRSVEQFEEWQRD